MALQKQTIEIPFGVGVDTKTDAKQVQPGKLLALENAIFQRLGKLVKRLGLRPLAQVIFGGGTVSTGRALTTFQKELNLIDGTSFYSYYEGDDEWVTKSKIWGVDLKYQLLNRSGGGSTCAVGAGLILYAEGGGISVHEVENGQLIQKGLTGVGEVFPGGLLFLNGLFYIYHGNPSGVSVSTFNPATFSTSASAVVFTPAASNQLVSFVARPMGSNIVLVAAEWTQLVIGLAAPSGLFAATPTVLATGTISSTIMTEANVYPLFTGVPATDGIYVVWGQLTSISNTILRGIVLDTALATVAPAFTIATNAVNGAYSPSIGLGTSNRAILFYSNQVTAGFPWFDMTTHRVQLTRAGVIQDVATISSQAFPASNPFEAYGQTMVILTHPSDTGQAQYIIMTAAGETVAAFSYQNGVPGGVSRIAPNNVSILGTNSFVYCCGRVGRSIGGSKFLSQSQIIAGQSVRMNFASENLFITQEIDQGLHIASGTVWNYDGVSLYEMGFRTFPQNVLATPTVGTFMGVGTRSYVAIYEWTDSRGQIYRSAPSTPAPFIIASGTNNASVKVSTPMFSSKPLSTIKIVLFRTVAGGTTYYRTGENGVVANVPFTSITDGFPDSNIISREILYTTGGVLENIPPPCATYVSEYNNRAFVMGLEDPNELWYSRQYLPGESPYFNDGLTLRVDQGAGGIVAGQTLDEKFIIFKEASIFLIRGQGPTDTGSSNDYGQPQQVSIDVGCTEPKSVVTIPTGIIFKSSKGFYLLDRGLNTQYIGANVEEFNSLTVSSAVHIENQNQVRFTHSNGVAVFYDYLVGQWGTLTNFTAIGATEWNGTHTVVSSAGLVRVNDSATYLDSGLAVPMRLETPWIPLAGLQGFQRVYEASFLGDKISAHTFRVRVAYDYDNAWVETLTGLSSEITNSVEQFKVRPARQKCQSIKFEVTDLNPVPTAGEGLTLSSMSLTIGVKGGINRTKSGQVMT